MISLQDAKNRFSAVVEAALAGRPQKVSRRGKPAVVVVAIDEYARLVEAAEGNREQFADHLMAFPTGDGPERIQAQPREIKF